MAGRGAKAGLASYTGRGSAIASFGATPPAVRTPVRNGPLRLASSASTMRLNSSGRAMTFVPVRRKKGDANAAKNYHPWGQGPPAGRSHWLLVPLKNRCGMVHAAPSSDASHTSCDRV